ncbi:threonine ammonia-lyase [Jiulongibacter sediminis]|uniref:Tryptophan synthase beta chain-like PALP domain-containing protein n=1 Tax=Jiulongibacter sediminis TaxID=1605367 RepID=A0A0P7BZQ1_9BACT|nr:threonine/serine dehydratase [Jiulongibacter sediminis]KPM47143.1 hypothetical protein AFM12_15100 [Jiulongibacter sediminis]
MFKEPTKQEIDQTHELIKPFIHKTRLVRSEELNELLDCEIWLKCENEQVASAFKTRGALNAVLRVSEDEASSGLVTHSSGNHAQSLAYVGKMKQIKTYVVMPETAPKLKVEKVKSLGAELTFCQNTPEARQAAADKIMRETGTTFIHPFDNHQVICGQATVVKEILEELPETEIVIPPVGGGGLLSGSGLSAGFYSEKCLVFAAEPEGAADAVKSFSTGKVEKADYVKTFADGLQTHLSKRTLQLIRKSVEDVLLAKEASIPKAMELVKTFFDMYIEPSAAVPLAMLMDHKEIFSGKKVVLIITGGNIEPSEAEELMQLDDAEN